MTYAENFVTLDSKVDEIYSFKTQYGTTNVCFWSDTFTQKLSSEGTHFVYVYQGTSKLEVQSTKAVFEITNGMYCSIPGQATLTHGSGIIISHLNCKGVFTIGGPIESVGRLPYIDGCSDSLLIPPQILGEPCLNHLHFPPNISQTRHTHPSIRIGLIAKGYGFCKVPASDGSEYKITLQPGTAFVIPVNGLHSFLTDESTMDVIAFHPDSDFGPSRDNHPMVNKTLVGGISVASIEDIRTAKIFK